MQPDTSPERPVLDVAHLREQTGDDPALANEVIEIFRGQAESWGRLLTTDQDPGTWADAAHAIKGAALGIGAFQLAERCAEAERVGRSGSPSPVQTALVLSDVREALNAALDAAAALTHRLAMSASFSASNASNS